MWSMLNETVHKHVHTVNKRLSMKRRDWCTNNSKELRSESHRWHRTGWTVKYDSVGIVAAAAAAAAAAKKLSSRFAPGYMTHSGLLDRWGIPGKPPREESPQTLPHRVRPRKEGFPLEKTGRGRTQAQPAQSTWTLALLRPQHLFSLKCIRRERSRNNGDDICWLYITSLYSRSIMPTRPWTCIVRSHSQHKSNSRSTLYLFNKHRQLEFQFTDKLFNVDN